MQLRNLSLRKTSKKPNKMFGFFSFEAARQAVSGTDTMTACSGRGRQSPGIFCTEAHAATKVRQSAAPYQPHTESSNSRHYGHSPAPPRRSLQGRQTRFRLKYFADTKSMSIFTIRSAYTAATRLADGHGRVHIRTSAARSTT